MNASMTTPAPINHANAISRARPSTRDTVVSPATSDQDPSSPFFLLSSIPAGSLPTHGPDPKGLFDWELASRPVGR